MSALLLAGMAKANDHFNRPWLFAAIYVFLMFISRVLLSLTPRTSVSILGGAAFTFIVVGVLLTLLYRYQDSIFAWLGTLFAGLFILSGGAKLLFGLWFPL